jgi:hypothetical protein
MYTSVHFSEKSKIVVYLMSSCVNWVFLARIGHFKTRVKRGAKGNLFYNLQKNIKKKSKCVCIIHSIQAVAELVK